MGSNSLPGEWPKASWAILYLAVYLTYLWCSLEGELGHWVSLVLVPLLALWALGRAAEPELRVRDVARRLGLAWPAAGRGMRGAVMAALVIQLVQLLNRTQRVEVASVLSSSSALWIIPAALIFMLLSAGFTEEFFFRGILQRSWSARFRSHAYGIVATSVAFSLYHLPYAYLNPFWPSAGDLSHALRLAFVNGLLGGVVLGILFVRSRESLLPCILLHAAIDWVPAIRMFGKIKFGA